MVAPLLIVLDHATAYILYLYRQCTRVAIVLLYPVNWWSFDLVTSEIISPKKLCSTLPHELIFCRGVKSKYGFVLGMVLSLNLFHFHSRAI